MLEVVIKVSPEDAQRLINLLSIPEHVAISPTDKEHYKTLRYYVTLCREQAISRATDSVVL